MADVLAFWAAALVVAAFGYPIGAVLLRRLPDGGAGVALPLGLVLASYGYFILRVLDLLPPGRGGYLGAIALLGLAGAAAMGRDRWSVVTLRRGPSSSATTSTRASARRRRARSRRSPSARR